MDRVTTISRTAAHEKCRRNKALFVVAVVLQTAFAYTAHAERIRYVDANAPGMGAGSSWENAYNYLQDALYNASPGTEIRVAQGIYRPDESRYRDDPGDRGDRKASFQLMNAVILKGGYADLGEPDPNERDVGLYETILSGDLNGDDATGLINYDENSYHVVTGSDTDETAVLDGFTITAGNADGDHFYFQDVGGGMFSNTGSPTVLNCAFIENSAYDGQTGGGMCNYNGSNGTLNNCTFSDNIADNDGGGMSNYSSSPTLTDCTFSGNYAGGMSNFNSSPTLNNCIFSGNIGDEGGAISNYALSSPTLSNCIFSGNDSDHDGGGMSNYDSHPVLANCSFSDNTVERDGGGMSNHNSSPTLTDCIFIDNFAERDAGGMLNSDGSNPILLNCTFSGNIADDQGGGMHSDDVGDDCYPELTNCTFIGNSAPEGGGMCNLESSPTLTNCTFHGNSADYGAGTFSNDVTLMLTDCTFSDNSALLGGGMFNRNSSLTVMNCTFSGNVGEGATETYEGGGAMCNIMCVVTASGSVFTGNMSIDGGGMANYGLYSQSTVTLNNCTFRNNAAGDSGGGVMNHYVDVLEMTGCVFSGNSAGDEGGGMDNYETFSTIIDCAFIGNSAINGGGLVLENDDGSTLTNCIFTGNWAENGGGIWAEDEDVTMTNCTFSRNVASNGNSAAGIAMNERVKLSNCIFWANVADGSMSEAAQIQVRQSVNTIVDYSCVQAWTGDLGGIGNIGDDPLFIDPDGADNEAGTEDDNLRLSLGSPCINTGVNSALTSTVHADLDGKARIIMDVVDMGAYEFCLLIVDDDAPDDPGPGDPQVSDPNENGTEAHPFDSIQQALDAAGDGYTVQVRQGRYTEPDNEDKIDFLDKNIALTSSHPTDWDVVENTVIDGYVQFGGSEDPNCRLTGFKIHNIYLGAIYGNHTHATISHCNISGNGPCAATVIKDCDEIISNCLITDNTTFFRCGVYPVVFGCNGLIKNCTIANNDSGLSAGTATIENCIIYDNMGFQLAVADGESLSISYSNVQGGLEGIVGDGHVNRGPGNIDTDPCFVRSGYWIMDRETLIEGDYHLTSEGWRWNTERRSWSYDHVTSRCIDAGNPGWPLDEELAWVPRDPNNEWGVNRRINMGAFGGTAQAGMPPHNWMYPGDLDNNGCVDYMDLAGQTRAWLIGEDRQPSSYSIKRASMLAIWPFANSSVKNHC